MASIIVSGSAAVQYDDKNLYPGSTVYKVEDTYANYLKYVDDAAAGLVTISTAFNNVVNLDETYISKTVDFSAAAANTIGNHRVFDVTGTVRMKLWAVCATDLVGSANTAVLALGTGNGTSGFIAGTSAEAIDAGDIWCDTTPTEKDGAYSTLILDKAVVSSPVGYELSTAKLSTGVIIFHCLWTPLSPTGAVAVGNLSAMA